VNLLKTRKNPRENLWRVGVLMESGWRVEGFDGEWVEGGGF
jgi:hypothetical protein